MNLRNITDTVFIEIRAAELALGGPPDSNGDFSFEESWGWASNYLDDSGIGVMSCAPTSHAQWAGWLARCIFLTGL